MPNSSVSAGAFAIADLDTSNVVNFEREVDIIASTKGRGHSVQQSTGDLHQRPKTNRKGGIQISIITANKGFDGEASIIKYSKSNAGITDTVKAAATNIQGPAMSIRTTPCLG